MNLQILAQVLAVCVGLFAGIPQLVKSRQSDGAARQLARATGVLSLISSMSLTLVVTERFATLQGSESLLSALFVLPAIAAVGTWSAALIWAGPPTDHDKQTFIGAGIFVAATALTVIAQVVRGSPTV